MYCICTICIFTCSCICIIVFVLYSCKLPLLSAVAVNIWALASTPPRRPSWPVMGIPLPLQHFCIVLYIFGEKDDCDFRISDLVKTLMELIFNPYNKFRWSPEGPVSQIHSPHLHVGAPGIFSHLLRSVQMLNREREWGAESNGKLPHLFNPLWN